MAFVKFSGPQMLPNLASHELPFLLTPVNISPNGTECVVPVSDHKLMFKQRSYPTAISADLGPIPASKLPLNCSFRMENISMN